MDKNKIEILEEKGIKNTLLYVKNIDVNQESYETKILTEDNIKDLIKFQITFDTDKRVLLFDVSNTISFEEYLKTKKLNKYDIIDILYSIDSVLSSVENYLISENSVSLDSRMIRVERKNNKSNFKFMAIPNYNVDFSYELSKFLIRMLRVVDVDDKEALSLAYGLFVRSSKDNYTLNDLIELVDSAKDNNYINTHDFDIDSLYAYDEEMADELVKNEEFKKNDSIIMDNDEIDVRESNELEDVEDLDDGIIMDEATNDILKDELFDNFDGNKVIQFTKRNLKKKKKLNAHIQVSLFGFAIFPFVMIFAPIVFYMGFGEKAFINSLPYILGFEFISIASIIVFSIVSLKRKVYA